MEKQFEPDTGAGNQRSAISLDKTVNGPAAHDLNGGMRVAYPVNSAQGEIYPQGAEAVTGSSVPQYGAVQNPQYGQFSVQNPTQYQERYPGQNASHYQERYPGQNASQYQERYPGQNASQYQERYPGQNASQYQEQYPGQNPAQYQERYPGQNPAQYQNQYPGHMPGQNQGPAYAEPDNFRQYFSYETAQANELPAARRKAPATSFSDEIKNTVSRIQKDRKYHRMLMRFPYPLFVTAAFLAGGGVFNLWHPLWMLFLTIPLYYTAIEAVYKKNANIFCYPVLVTLLYLTAGFALNLWHPGWLAFLTIPFYYWIVNTFGKNDSDDDDLTGKKF